MFADTAHQGEPVGARLFLADSPAFLRALRDEIAPDQVRPRDSGFRFDESMLRVESPDAIERSHVEQRSAGQELLSAHRVPRSRDRKGFAAVGRLLHGAHHVVDPARFDAAARWRCD